MAFLSKDKVKEILAGAPEGTTPEGIVAGLRQQGHVLEGYVEPGKITTEQLRSPEYEAKSTEELFLGEAAKVSRLAYQGFQQLPGIEQARKAGGFVTGIAGAAIGGGIRGLLGLPMGMFTGEGAGTRAWKEAKAGWHEGYETFEPAGKAVPEIAIGIAGGAVVEIPLAIMQLTSGADKYQQAFELAEEGDIEGTIMMARDASIDVVLGIASISGAVRDIKGNEKVLVELNEQARVLAAEGDMKGLNSVMNQIGVLEAPKAAKFVSGGFATPGLVASREMVNSINYLKSPEHKFNRAKNSVDDYIGKDRNLLKAQARAKAKALATGEPVDDINDFMTREGLIPNQKITGKRGLIDRRARTYDSKDAINNAKQRFTAVNDMYTSALDDIDPIKRYDLNLIMDDIEVSLRKKISGKNAEARAITAITSEMDKHIAEHGTSVSGGTLNKIKREMYGGGKYETMAESGKAYRFSGELIAEILEDGYGDTLDINNINKVMGRYLESMKILGKLDTKTIPKSAVPSSKSWAMMSGYASRSSGIPLIGSMLGMTKVGIADYMDVKYTDEALTDVARWLRTNPKTEADVITEMMTGQMATEQARRVAVPKLKMGAEPGAPENPIIASAKGETPIKPKTGQIVTEPPVDISDVTAAKKSGLGEFPEPSVATAKTLRNVTGKMPTSGKFKITSKTTWHIGKDGKWYIKNPGAVPTRLNSQEVAIFSRAGVLPDDPYGYSSKYFDSGQVSEMNVQNQSFTPELVELGEKAIAKLKAGNVKVGRGALEAYFEGTGLQPQQYNPIIDLIIGNI